MAIAGSKLIVADTANHRVVIYPSLTATAPDTVLGQADLTSNSGAIPASASSFADPVSVWSDGTRLLVTSKSQNRILMWNTIPTTDATPADLVIGQASDSTTATGTGMAELDSPEHAFISGTKVFVVDGGNSRVLAEMNHRIVIAQAAGPTVPANDLLDQRDALIADLNKLIKTSTVVERDGQMSVFVGSGQSLVIGQSVAKLGVVSTPDDLERGSIAMIAPNGVAINLPENLLTGGELGGLLAFRRETLDASRDQLNRIARQFSDTFNEQHRKGVTLEGVLGGDFFKLDMVTSDGGDLALAPGVAITNDSLLTNDRYSGARRSRGRRRKRSAPRHRP